MGLRVAIFPIFCCVDSFSSEVKHRKYRIIFQENSNSFLVKLLDAVGCLYYARLAGVAAYCAVFLYRFLCLVGTFVVEVQHYCRVAYLLGLYAEVEEALAKFAVLSTVLHLFVVSVYAHHVFAPP